MEYEKVTEMLETRAALQISLIGIGNAGNQLLNEAIKHNIEVFAINSSHADLNNSVVDKSIKSFIVGDEARGAGKNRALALSYLKANGKELMTSVPAFTNMCERSDVIIVASSTAGGTGSGISPAFISLLKHYYPSKIIMYCGILPRLTDVKAQENSIRCLSEIDKQNVPYILADLEYYAGVPNDIAYREVQLYIIDCINSIRGKYLNKSSFGMIDENDMRTVISEPGYLSIYNLNKVSQNQLDKESMQQMMIKQIKHSPAVEIMRDGIVHQMAAIINMPENMSDSSKASDYNELINYIGRPLTIFENYAITQSATGQMVIILSGQTTPYNRISKMNEIVAEYTERANKQKNFNLDTLCSNELKEEIPAFLKCQNSEENRNKQLDDFFDSL